MELHLEFVLVTNLSCFCCPGKQSDLAEAHGLNKFRNLGCRPTEIVVRC